MSIMQIVIAMSIVVVYHGSPWRGREESHHPDPPQSLSNLRHIRSRSQASDGPDSFSEFQTKKRVCQWMWIFSNNNKKKWQFLIVVCIV